MLLFHSILKYYSPWMCLPAVPVASWWCVACTAFHVSISIVGRGRERVTEDNMANNKRRRRILFLQVKFVTSPGEI
ncbi:unnamed protein product [Linum tenue]|uniref:Secreted protein n=1 Tax=Linum tenue TaxID=586396 RepID=A0AAV0R6J2_9ROSI|nr:unnamed protein product [Linum tenue]